MDEEDEEDYYDQPQKNQTPLIIGGIVGGVLVLIILLALVASTKDEPIVEESTESSSGSGIDERALDVEAKDHMSSAQKYYRKMMSGSNPSQRKSDQNMALAEVDNAIQKWTKLHSIHPDYTGIEHDIELANRLRIDIMRSGQW
ncbi:MAG: hypothetical protein ACYS8W_08150 [Planctomycetota bacterium]|jgi:hypothetical protein